MRLILARLIWNFDLKLAEESHDWARQSKVFLLWEKGPVMVHLTPRRMESPLGTSLEPIQVDDRPAVVRTGIDVVDKLQVLEKRKGHTQTGDT